MRSHRPLVAGAALAAIVAAGLAATPMATATTASPPTSATYTLAHDVPTTFTNVQADSPASPFIDKDGTFHTQQSNSLYGADDTHEWGISTGTSMDDVHWDGGISTYANPSNPVDKNNETTYRCENSPTGLEATPSSGATYVLSNYCDLIGTWVDPDTGDWIGLVHNEFTGSPFGDGMHYDSIDRAISHDQGKTWTIDQHALTSPFSTLRATAGGSTAFPNDTYYFGDGDQRLFVDVASGYFYVYYSTQIIDKSGGGATKEEHVARAPLSGKLAIGWQKWYHGAWSQPGVGGKESNLIPAVSSTDTGYSPAIQEYNPNVSGKIAAQIAAGTLAPDSDLLYMSVTYDAYLGLYLAEAEPPGLSDTTKKPMPLFATSDLSTQKWFKIADTGDAQYAYYWYHWFIDSGSKTSGTIVGKSFREYCNFFCRNSESEYTTYTLDSDHPADVIDTAKVYQIVSAPGTVLAKSSTSASAVTSVPSGNAPPLTMWQFRAIGDGSYSIKSLTTGLALGVPTAPAGRAWGTAPTLAADTAATTVGQQWFVIPNRGANSQIIAGSFRLINRYSGLALALPASGAPETTPVRAGSDVSGSTIGGARTEAQQTLTLTAKDFPVVTASSQSTSTGQGAYNVVDGVVGGYPANATAEWATTGEKAGAWVKLQWPSPRTVQSVVLHDRPDQSDQVTSGTLTLSNGTVVPFAALPNDGKGLTVTLPTPVQTSSLLVTVGTVRSSTSNIGLSEIEVRLTQSS